MRLRVKAKCLAQQFVRLGTYCRRQLELQRDIVRMMKALEARSPAKTQLVAIHEAGHTVLQIALDLDFGFVSIIPDTRTGTAGQVFGARGDATAGLSTAA